LRVRRLDFLLQKTTAPTTATAITPAPPAIQSGPLSGTTSAPALADVATTVPVNTTGDTGGGVTQDADAGAVAIIGDPATTAATKTSFRKAGAADGVWRQISLL
jgi:hypothetical protein